MIDLEKIKNSDSHFEIVYAGKSKTFVCSSLILDSSGIFADWSGNLWKVDFETKKIVWKQKLKKPLLFGFYVFENRIYSVHQKAIIEILPDGEILEKIELNCATSPIQINNQLFINERNKHGFNSMGKLVAYDMQTNKLTTIFEEKIKRTFLPITNKEQTSKGSELFFFADRSIYKYNTLTTNLLCLKTNNEIRDRITGMIFLDNDLLYIPSIKNKNAGQDHFPPNPDINSIFSLDEFGNQHQISETKASNTMCHSGNSISIDKYHHLVCLANYVFSKKSETFLKVEIPIQKSGGTEHYLFMNGEQLYCIVPRSYGDRATEQGFNLYELNIDNLEFKLCQEYRTHKLGKNFKGIYFDFFRDKICARGDGRFYVMKKASEIV